MMRRILPLAGVILVVCATSAAADETTGPYASGVFAAAVGGSNTKPAFAGLVGYRFNTVLGLEVEVAGIPDFAASRGRGPMFAVRTPRGGVSGTDVEGRAVFLTTNFRAAIPIGLRRVTPYFTAGGGLVSLRQEADVTVLEAVAEEFEGSGGDQSADGPFPVPRLGPTLTRAATDLTLGLGGGISFLLGRGLSLDADLRYFRVLSARDMNLGRFGIGVGYRF